MRSRRVYWTLLLWMLASLTGSLVPSGWGQISVGTEVTPAAFSRSKKEKLERPLIHPFAQALAEHWQQATWIQMGLSSSSIREDLTQLFYRGFYRLELIQLVLMAKETSQKLENLLQERRRRARLSEIAEKNHLQYPAIYENALQIKSQLARKEEKSHGKPVPQP